MNTFLGASQFLPPAALDEDLIASAGVLYLEGYLWDPEEPRSAMRRAIEVARGIRTGTVWINDYHLLNALCPFGGYKQSGNGREWGAHGIDEFLEVKSIYGYGT